MQDLATSRSRASISQVRLRLVGTDIPYDAIPKNERGDSLILPTDARLSVNNDGIRIEMILLDRDLWGDQFYTAPTFDDEHPPILPLNLPTDEIVRLQIGGWTQSFNPDPTAVLVIRDPYDVVESLTLTFASTDPHNPGYAIKALAKMVRERLGVAVQETKVAPPEFDEDVPF